MPDLPVCLGSVLVRPLPALYFRDSDPANYISHTSLLAGLQLGSANGRHWLETGGWEEGRSQGISPHLSLSLCSVNVLAIAAPPPWPQLPRPGPLWFQLPLSGPSYGAPAPHLLTLSLQPERWRQLPPVGKFRVTLLPPHVALSFLMPE